MKTADEIYQRVKELPEPVAREILDFVELNAGKVGVPTLSQAQRLKRLRSACGVWKNRTDLPDFQSVRREWDRLWDEVE